MYLGSPRKYLSLPLSALYKQSNTQPLQGIYLFTTKKKAFISPSLGQVGLQ